MDIDMDVDLGPVEDEIAFHVNLAIGATPLRRLEVSNINSRASKKTLLLHNIRAMGEGRSKTRPRHLTRSISVVWTTLPRTTSDLSQQSTILLVPQSAWSGSTTHLPISSSTTQSLLPELLKTSPSLQTNWPCLPCLRYNYVEPRHSQRTRRLFYKFAQHWSQIKSSLALTKLADFI